MTEAYVSGSVEGLQGMTLLLLAAAAIASPEGSSLAMVSKALSNCDEG